MTLAFSFLDDSQSDGPLMRGIIKGCKAYRGITEENKELFIGSIFGKKNNQTTNITNKFKEDTTITDVERNKLRKLDETVNEKIRKNFVNSMQSIVQEAAISVGNKSSKDVSAVLTASQSFTVDGVTTDGDFNFSGNTQRIEAEQQLTMEQKKTVITDINNKISTASSNNITKHIKTSGEKIPDMLRQAVADVSAANSDTLSDVIASDANLGNTDQQITDKSFTSLGKKYLDTVGGVFSDVAGVANTGINAVAGVATAVVDGVFGGSKNTTSNTNNETEKTKNISKTKETDQEIITKKKNVDEDIQKVNLEEELSNSINNSITNESYDSCASTLTNSQKQVIKDVKAGGNVNINNNVQEMTMKQTMNCLFDETVKTKIVTDFINNMEKKLESSNIADEQIEAAGIALAAAVSEAGDAAAKAIEKKGKAAGEVIKERADGKSKILQQKGENENASEKSGNQTFIILMIIIGIVLLIGGYLYLQTM